MRRLFLILFLLVSATCSAQYSRDTIKPADSLEISPSFPGGSAAMSNFIKKNFSYPESAKEAGISGKVWVSFKVGTDGTLSEIRLVRGISECPECDREALRLVSIMPAWNPTKKGGIPVTSQINLPFTFRMQ
jgi:protein TonB